MVECAERETFLAGPLYWADRWISDSLQMTQDVFEVMTGSATMVEVNEKYVKSREFDSRA
jgi:hypothetical protein